MVPNNSASARIKMSEYEIPFHIQEEIMKWLPVKSLLQFRCVSKAWKSLIDSPEFIAAHNLCIHTQPQFLLVSYEYTKRGENYVCFVDDETLPKQRVRMWPEVVTTDQFIYWCVEFPARNMIMSFDLTSECFEVIDLPVSLPHRNPLKWKISKLWESLAILQSGVSILSTVVWMMEGGVQRSFTKLFTIDSAIYSIVGFRMSGVPMVQSMEDNHFKLAVYEPNSEHNNVLQISGDPIFFSVTTYMESLFLLGRSDCSSY